MDRDHLSNQRWDFDDSFSLFFGWAKLVHFHPSDVRWLWITLKVVYSHALMSVLGIFINLNQYGRIGIIWVTQVGLRQFQPTFLAILDQIWPITPLRQTMKPLKLVCYHDLTSVLGIYVSTQTNNGFEWPKVGFWRFQPIFLAILGLILTISADYFTILGQIWSISPPTCRWIL